MLDDFGGDRLKLISGFDQDRMPGFPLSPPIAKGDMN